MLKMIVAGYGKQLLKQFVKHEYAMFSSTFAILKIK